jgi:hypothetical protein
MDNLIGAPHVPGWPHFAVGAGKRSDIMTLIDDILWLTMFSLMTSCCCCHLRCCGCGCNASVALLDFCDVVNIFSEKSAADLLLGLTRRVCIPPFFISVCDSFSILTIYQRQRNEKIFEICTNCASPSSRAFCLRCSVCFWASRSLCSLLFTISSALFFSAIITFLIPCLVSASIW